MEGEEKRVGPAALLVARGGRRRDERASGIFFVVLLIWMSFDDDYSENCFKTFVDVDDDLDSETKCFASESLPLFCLVDDDLILKLYCF